jgi:hypothetical protein
MINRTYMGFGVYLFESSLDLKAILQCKEGRLECISLVNEGESHSAKMNCLAMVLTYFGSGSASGHC